MVHPIVIPDRAMERLKNGNAVEIREYRPGHEETPEVMILYGDDDPDDKSPWVWEIPVTNPHRKFLPYHLPTFESIGFEPADPVEPQS